MSAEKLTEYIKTRPGLRGNDYILNAALRQSGLLDEVFATQENINLNDILSLRAEEAAKIFSSYSAASHTIVDDSANR
jgi:hypothetical protein